MPRHKTPTAPLESLTPFRGNFTRLLNVAAAAPALLLVDIGHRSCEGIMAGFTGYHESGDRCWKPSWSQHLVLFVRAFLFILGVLLLIWPEVQLHSNQLVRRFILLDAWNRLRFNVSISWGFLLGTYVLGATTRHQPISFVDYTAVTLVSLSSYLGFACVVSYISATFRRAVHYMIYRTDIPEKLASHGQWTIGLLAVYRLALQIDGHWSLNVIPMLMGHIFLDFDCAEIFRLLLRPIILNNDFNVDQNWQRRATSCCFAMFATGFIAFTAALLIPKGATVQSAFWYTVPSWLLIPWLMRVAAERMAIQRSDLIIYWLWSSHSKLLKVVTSVVGQFAYAVVSLPLYGLIIYMFRGHRAIAWILWTFFLASIYQMIDDACTAYLLMAPHRAVYRWISSQMTEPRPTDPRLVNDSCAICYVSPLDSSDTRLTVCNHMYHIRCLSMWLVDQHTCPTCRRHLRPPGSFAF